MPLIYRRTRFLAVSESTRRELADIGIPAERCRVVHNGLDHRAYHKVVKRSAAPRLLYVGRLKRHKRVDLIIDLCARLQADVPDLVLDVVGTGDDEARLRELVVERGLENVVRFHGFVSHARKLTLYSRAWALLTATEREGWGLSIMEAAACGTPSLCLDVPGVRDAVEHGASGWLASDMDGLYEATKRFLRDAAWRQRLSDGAQERARLFSWRASAAGAREALVEAWLVEKRIPLRRTLRPVQRQPLTWQRHDIPDSVWPAALESLRQRLRFGDEIHLRDDVIHIDAAVSDAAELEALKNRMNAVLNRFAQAGTSQTHHEEHAVANA